MKLLVGLGNPGKKYTNTRHNIGFRVLDALAKKRALGPWRSKKELQASFAMEGAGAGRALYAKPTTMMNLSGEAVVKLKDYYRLASNDIIIISDDLDLPLGVLRIRLGGSSGGHNGLKSIISALGDEQFWRLRVGIGSDPQIPAEQYVLASFREEEEVKVAGGIDKAVELLENAITHGVKEETVQY